MNQPVDNVPDRILAEATQLFAERGFAGTSIAAVAKAAGITKPTLLYHFGSKEGLRTAVLDRLMAHWRDELPRLMLAAQGQGPRLDALLGVFFAFFGSRPELARLVVRESLDRPEALQELLREQMQPWTGLLTQAVRIGQERGTIRARVDAEAFTVLVISTALGVLSVAPAAAALVSPEPDQARLTAELLRITRVSLLNPEEG